MDKKKIISEILSRFDNWCNNHEFGGIFVCILIYAVFILSMLILGVFIVANVFLIIFGLLSGQFEFFRIVYLIVSVILCSVIITVFILFKEETDI